MHPTHVALCTAAVVAAALLIQRHRRRRRDEQHEQQQHEQLAASVADDPAPLLVMSFGCVCLTARSLGTAGARTFAAPFDWIFSNPAIVSHIISDDGTDLLDQTQCFKAKNGNSDVGYGHRRYSPMLSAGPNGQNKHGIIFNHHDPLQAEDHAYLTRAVRRLRAALASPLPKLCVILSLEKRGSLVDSDLDDLVATLERCSHKAAKVTLVAVRLLTAPHADEGSDAAGAPPAGFGVLPATVRELHLRHTTLRTFALRCRGGLGPSALALSDEADRCDLLKAIFAHEPSATFDAAGKLLNLRLAADPWTAHTDGAAASAEQSSRQLRARRRAHRKPGDVDGSVEVADDVTPLPKPVPPVSAGRVGKYRDDRWLIARV